MGGRLRDLVEAEDGAVYAWTDKADLIKIRAVETDAVFADKIASLDEDVRDILLGCATCHEFDRGSEGGGKISLFNIYRAKAARGEDRHYSKAMLAKRDEPFWWDDWQLDRFLSDPNKVVSGTTMQFGGVEDRDTRLGVISFIKTLY
jgi:cytochrome c